MVTSNIICVTKSLKLQNVIHLAIGHLKPMKQYNHSIESKVLELSQYNMVNKDG